MPDFHVKNLTFLNRGPYDLTLEAGKIMAVSGSSGSGKSLLLRAIADLEPNSGAMFLDGRSYLDFSGPDWRRQVMYLPAESHWWQEKVSDHLVNIPVAGIFAEYGFSAEVADWEISRLSSGEKQRLAILRVLLNRPAILLLDEPTASLDPQSVSRIESLLLKYVKSNGAAAIWVSHDPNQIDRIADRHIEIHSGGGYKQVK